MGLVWNRRKRLGKGVTLNLSKGGASLSKRRGRVTINSRGRASIRLGRGFSFRL
jgi:hypothetical protein